MFQCMLLGCILLRSPSPPFLLQTASFHLQVGFCMRSKEKRDRILQTNLISAISPFTCAMGAFRHSLDLPIRDLNSLKIMQTVTALAVGDGSPYSKAPDLASRQHGGLQILRSTSHDFSDEYLDHGPLEGIQEALKDVPMAFYVSVRSWLL